MRKGPLMKERPPPTFGPISSRVKVYLNEQSEFRISLVPRLISYEVGYEASFVRCFEKYGLALCIPLMSIRIG